MGICIIWLNGLLPLGGNGGIWHWHVDASEFRHKAVCLCVSKLKVCSLLGNLGMASLCLPPPLFVYLCTLGT